MSSFEILHRWLPEKERGLAPSTLGCFQVRIENRNVTEYEDDRGRLFEHLEIPAYYVAEWIADNWWSLLCEPRKSEDGNDGPEFMARHSFLTAQHGFALPKIMIVALGKSLEISAVARDAPLASVRFKHGKHSLVSAASGEDTLRRFVEKVVARLIENRIEDSYLQEAWTLISETEADEISFCRAAGALGISPYDIEDSLSDLILRTGETLGEKLLTDLCLVSTPQTFGAAVSTVEKAKTMTRDASASTLEPLKKLSAPKDNLQVPAHRRGVNAAHNLRKMLNISETDPRGATKVFDLLKIDTTQRTGAEAADEQVAITGAVVRDDLEMKVALLQSSETKRRFAGARAVFAAWSADELRDSRLLTSAVTRDQQANRAFAAELTAPIMLVRKSVKAGRLSHTAIWDLAGDLQVGADVIRKQAVNNGISVSAA